MGESCKIPPKLKTTTHKSFESCKKVTFEYIRNTEKSTYLGARYGQDIEPRGTYLLEKESDYVVPGWETGTITFESPLVIPHENTV